MKVSHDIFHDIFNNLCRNHYCHEIRDVSKQPVIVMTVGADETPYKGQLFYCCDGSILLHRYILQSQQELSSATNH